MSNEPRKASDVLLELESKVDMLLNLVKNQDLNIKILSNKLNSFFASKPNQQVKVPTIEAINQNIFESQPQIPISSESKIPVDNSPQGFRRTSRPETYSADNLKQNTVDNKILDQKAEIIVPKSEESQVVFEKQTYNNVIPVQQKVVDKNSKSVFLADVEVFNISSNEKVGKTRTNGSGKWMISLPIGEYKVALSKRDALTKEKIELFQNIKVDGNTSPLSLPILIFK